MKSWGMGLIVVVGLVVGLTSPTWGTITESHDINTYVLFGLESVSVKGQNADPTRGFIIGGNVGVNRLEPNTNSYLLNLGDGERLRSIR